MAAQMQAALLGSDRVLRVQAVERPTLRSGGAIISVLATGLPPYTDEVVYGRSFHVLPELPTIPGAAPVGIVEQVADDVYDLHPGQLVAVDPQVRPNRRSVALPRSTKCVFWFRIVLSFA